MLKEDVLFKKTPFGGFDRVEVISYIHQLKSTQQKYKVLLEEKEKANTRLSRDLEDREIMVEQLRKDIRDCEKTIEEDKQTIAELRAEIDKLSREADCVSDGEEKQYASETVRMCDELVETATDTAKKIVSAAEDKLDDVHKRISDAVGKLEENKNMKPKEAKDMLKKLLEELK